MTSQTVTDSTISRTIRGIIAFTRMPTGAFRSAAGLSRSTYYNKINGETPWTADEVAHIANVLGVSILDLYNGRVPPDLPTWPRTSAPAERGISGFPRQRDPSPTPHDRHPAPTVESNAA